MTSLYEKLWHYGQTDVYPMHMPGHKRQLWPDGMERVYRMDITEIDGFDNLHQARGVIKEAQDYAADLFGSSETHFMVNGSSGGLLAAIAALCPPGSRLAAARNCHKAVFHAIELLHLDPVYIYPQVSSQYGIPGAIDAQEAERALTENPDVRALVLTSPSYEGVVSDIPQICRRAHALGIPVIVDEAHGAHFIFSDYFPESAVRQGADLVVQSSHKTLPALTQTALLHINGSLVDRDRVRRMLTVFQTSSPSYILMGSIEESLRIMADQPQRIRDYRQRLQLCRQRLADLGCFHLLNREDFADNAADYDRSKLVVCCPDGPQLYRRLLEDYHIQLEMKAPLYILGMTSAADSREGFDRFEEALMKLDRQGDWKEKDERQQKLLLSAFPRLQRALPLGEAFWADLECLYPDQAQGRICGDYIYLYPPGIPLAVPGEILTEQALDMIRAWRQSGMEVEGTAPDGKIRVLAE